VIHQNKFQNVCSEIREGVELCKSTCEYFAICGGGAPANKVSETSYFNVSEHLACKVKLKLTADVLMDDIESSLDLYESTLCNEADSVSENFALS
jgi:uncharacterized protein